MTAAESIQECRAILGAPSRATMAWDAMTLGDRQWLCRAAKLPDLTAWESWDDLDAADQAKLRGAARRAAAWARRMIEAIG